MAEQCELEEVYEFFYHGTSKAVHSDIHRMIQMVSFSSEEKLNISSQGMAGYHSVFSLAYGLWLIEELFQRIIQPEFSDAFSLIDSKYSEVL